MTHAVTRWLSLLLCLWALPAHAAALTLSQALERALARHPAIRAARAEVGVARAKEDQARSLSNPSLTLQAAEMPLSNPANGNLLAGVSWPLPIGGMRAARSEIARLETAMAESEVRDQERELLSQVTIAYAAFQHHAERVRLARAAFEDAGRLSTAAETRYRSGDVPRAEVFRAEVERNRARRDLLVAERQLVVAKERLGLLVGEPGEELAPAALSAPRLELPPLDSLRERMWAARPAARRSELAIAVEEQHRLLAQASVWDGSEVSVGGGLAAGQPAVSTSLTLPLPLNRNQAEVAAAEARLRQAELRRDVQRLQLGMELAAAHGEAAIALTGYRLLAEVDLPQARRFADNARRRYLAGEGSGLEAMDAARTLRDVEAEHLQALQDYRASLARLEETLGAPLP